MPSYANGVVSGAIKIQPYDSYISSRNAYLGDMGEKTITGKNADEVLFLKTLMAKPYKDYYTRAAIIAKPQEVENTANSNIEF